MGRNGRVHQPHKSAPPGKSNLFSVLFGAPAEGGIKVEGNSLGRDQLEVLKYSKSCIDESPGIRLLTMLYAERKLVFFFLVHFVCTMLCWQHFTYSKFRVTEASTPQGANRYWWKRMVPAFEFGTMHAILFQLAIIPITMSRYTIATLSRTLLSKVIPFNHMTTMHIYLGYTIVLIVLLATFTFFTFFGLLCEEQKRGIEPRPLGAFTFCDKFTEEIMATGYGLMAILLILFFSSFFRQSIPYELFYGVHHLVFGMFGLTIAHTFDDKFRQGQVRSQTFKWFAATILWYFTDRLYMWSTRSSMSVQELIALGEVGETNSTNRDTPRVIILRVKKPVTFGYVPGQYASLRISHIDVHWHPFSFASEPSQPCLEFYMMVSSHDSWTGKLWKIAKESNSTGCPLPFQYIDVIGPYGTCIDTSSHMHICGIGAGTGIVSMLSVLKATVNLLSQINPRSHAEAQAGIRANAKELVVQQKEISKSFRHLTRRSLSGSVDNEDCNIRGDGVERVMIGKAAGNEFCIGDDEKENSGDDCIPSNSSHQWNASGKDRRRMHVGSMENGEGGATASKCCGERDKSLVKRVSTSSKGLDSSMTASGGVNTSLLKTRMRKLWLKEIMKLAFLLAPIWELLVSGLTISWHHETAPTTDVRITNGMRIFLKIGTIICTLNFGVIWLASFEALFFEAWVDILFVAVSIVSTIWWCNENSWCEFNTLQICAFLGLSIYRGIRTWAIANSSLNDSIQSQVSKLGVSPLLKTASLNIVWICRDTAMVEFLWPEIDAYWMKLQQTWGMDAGKVVTIRIYVTTSDKSARVRLKKSVRNTALYASGALQFGRPDIFDIIQDQLVKRVEDDANAGGVSAASSTLVAFCGTPKLGNIVGKHVMNVQIIAEATKHGHHTLSYYQENYGIPPSKESTLAEKDLGDHANTMRRGYREISNAVGKTGAKGYDDDDRDNPIGGFEVHTRVAEPLEEGIYRHYHHQTKIMSTSSTIMGGMKERVKGDTLPFY